MATQRQPQTTTTHAPDPLQGLLDKKVSYKPFMADDPIELSARMVLEHLAKPTRDGNTCPPDQAIRFVKLCEARGLNPWEGDAFLVGYDTNGGKSCEFNVITSHQAFLKRAEIHPEFNGMESGVSLKPKGGGAVVDLPGDYFDFELYEIVGGWARVHFKSRAIPTYRRVRLLTYAKNFGRWKDDPAGMICKVAEADALRSSFPTKLGGCYLREEIDSTHREPKERPSIDMPRGTDEPPIEPETTPLEDYVDETLAGKQEEPPTIDRRAVTDDVCHAMDQATTLKELRDAYGTLPVGFTSEDDELSKQIVIKKDERKHSLLRDEADYLATDLHMTLEQLQAFAKKQKIASLDQMDIKQLERLVAALTKALSEQEGGS